MFDLTKEVLLDRKSYRSYKKLQTALYALAGVGVLFLFYSILFPSAYFTFSFLNPNSSKNTIIDPRTNDGNSAEHGKFPLPSHALFDTALVGNYSKAKIDITLDKKSDALRGGNLSIKKSYQAFLYPEGGSTGFKDGTLLKNNNNYFIISLGKLRRFRNPEILKTLGFPEEAFREVSENDLKYNEIGDSVDNPQEYPDDSLFRIDDDYYILIGQNLKKFVSSQAYLSNYSSAEAINKGREFLSSYPLAEDLAGFADGSIISYGISVYIVSNGKILPVNNTVTFENMGYDWNDVIGVSGDEISLYGKDKLFTIDSPHPDGTIFITDEGSYYIVKDKQKYSLPTDFIAKSWIKNTPIEVSRNSLDVFQSCSPEKKFLSSRAYSCEISTEEFENLIGKDYEFSLSASNDIEVETLNVAFKKTVNWSNFKSAVRDILNKIRNNYVPEA